MSADALVSLLHLGNSSNQEAFSDSDGQITWRGLLRRVAGAAAALADMADPIGLMAPSSIDWVIADLAGWAAGKTIVPMPHFFSDAQLAHIVRDAGIRTLMTDDSQRDRLAYAGIARVPVPKSTAAQAPGAMRGRRIVYTSGSTGQPKGALLGPDQIHTSCAALMQATGAAATDRHLSVLPFSLLLEAICGIYLPILAGGHCVIAPQIVAATGFDVAIRLGEAVARHRPSTLVLVPQLLQAWVLAASVGRVEIPDSLRFVATGGAAVPDSVAARAWELGIPVHEGYGLTECGSVVAVNRPGRRRAGTVGQPLPGYDVRIAADGEIVVRSGAVAAGYLQRTDGPVGGIWHTGDVGALDADGHLQVSGRKDNLIVTANGRNISPEWVESMILADPRIARAVVLRAADGHLAAILEPSPSFGIWAKALPPDGLRKLVEAALRSAPRYAVPRHLKMLEADELATNALLTPNGKPRRREIGAAYAEEFDTSDEMETRNGVL